eukprot:603140-Pyramimonas_sp.AAC.1
MARWSRGEPWGQHLPPPPPRWQSDSPGSSGVASSSWRWAQLFRECRKAGDEGGTTKWIWAWITMMTRKSMGA